MKGKLAWLVTRYPSYTGEYCEPMLLEYEPEIYQYATVKRIVYFEIED